MKGYIFISGATSGIGKATALLLGKKGHSLILNGRRADRLELLQKELRPHCQVHLAPFDVSQPAELQSWFDQASSDLISQIQVLVNNAGLAKGKDPVQTAKPEDWNEMIDVNVKGLLSLTKACLPSLIEQKGHIINIGSVAGRWTYPGGAVYNATKFAVRALSEAFRMDLIGTGVRITNIEPGMVETEFSQVRLGSESLAKEVYEGMTPLSAQDVAETIDWALSRPPHVNIQELVIFPTDQASVRDVHRNERREL